MSPEGTINASSIYPREIMREAIKHNAASLIFVHNHPSGNPEPSTSDRSLTRDLVYAGCIMHVKVMDHIIIGDNRYFSFTGDWLTEEYLPVLDLFERKDFEKAVRQLSAKGVLTYQKGAVPKLLLTEKGANLIH